MNLLWEQFVFKSLRKYNTDDFTIEPQASKVIGERKGGIKSKIVPDIVVSKNNKHVVLDTKWKNIAGKNPSPEDLRQMYTYGKFHKDAHTALVYPGVETEFKEGRFLDEVDPKIRKNLCGILTIKVGNEIRAGSKAWLLIFSIAAFSSSPQLSCVCYSLPSFHDSRWEKTCRFDNKKNNIQSHHLTMFKNI
jgi:5-methylcytosine-specific restriction enzyme subunit McrC